VAIVEPLPAAASALRTLLWRGDGPAAVARPGIATGFAALDEALPGGGWPPGVLTELLAGARGIGEISLLLPALRRLAGQSRRWILWLAPPHIPYPPALEAAGIDPARLVVVSPRSPAEAIWAARQALAAGACSALLAWLGAPDLHALRRLQLAAEGGDTLAVLFRPPAAAHEPSPAPLRLQVEPAAGRLAVHVLKRRGPPLPGPLLLDLPDAPHALVRPLPAEPAAAGLRAWRA
jgi:cell division inhibitor SulA/protein ImuA